MSDRDRFRPRFSQLLWPASAVPVVALLAWGLTRDANTIKSPLIGARAPDFALETSDGKPLRLADLRGKVVVMNFWASWCLACEAEHPFLVRAEQQYANADVQILGVVYQDTRSNAMRYMRERGGGWPNLMDPGSRVAIEYGVYGVPETFFIDRDGTIAYKQIGPVNRDILDTWIQRLLAQPSGSSTAQDSLPAVGRGKGDQRRTPTPAGDAVPP
jgi:cytochrome c biogenesis protein CcmG/thiol:disulfide interchange protein DsbE